MYYNTTKKLHNEILILIYLTFSKNRKNYFYYLFVYKSIEIITLSERNSNIIIIKIKDKMNKMNKMNKMSNNNLIKFN